MFLGCSPCCDPCQIDWANVDSVTLTMRSDGHYVNNTLVVDTVPAPNTNNGRERKYSQFDFIAGFNGTLVLSRTQHNVQLEASVFGNPRIGSVWSLDLGGESGCESAVIEYQVAHALGNPSFLAGRTVAALFMTRATMYILESKDGPFAESPECTATPSFYTNPSVGCDIALPSGLGVCSGKVVSSSRFPVVRVECVGGAFALIRPSTLVPFTTQEIYRTTPFQIGNDENFPATITTSEQNEPIVYLEQISITSPSLDLTLSP